MPQDNLQQNKFAPGSIVGSSARGNLGDVVNQKLREIDDRSSVEKIFATASSPFRTITGRAGQTIGGAIGTGIARLRATPEERQFIEPGPSAGAVAGDIARSAFEIAGPSAVFKGLRAGGRAVSKLGEQAVKLAIPLSKAESGILQSYKASNPFLKRVMQTLKGTQETPRTMGQTTVEKGFAGLTRSGIGVQAKREAGKLWQTKISPALEASKEKVDIPGFLGEVEKGIIEKVVDPTRKNSLLEALSSIKEDFGNIGEVPLKQLQKFKEGWAEFVPEKTYQGKSIAGALGEVRNLLSREARTKIYNALGKEIKNDYLDYGNLKGLQELGKSAMTGEKLKGGAGSLVTDIAQRAVTPVATIGGQAIRKVGKGFTKLGELGRKKINLSPAKSQK